MTKVTFSPSGKPCTLITRVRLTSEKVQAVKAYEPGAHQDSEITIKQRSSEEMILEKIKTYDFHDKRVYHNLRMTNPKLLLLLSLQLCTYELLTTHSMTIEKVENSISKRGHNPNLISRHACTARI
jgi:hypothetical protein